MTKVSLLLFSLTFVYLFAYGQSKSNKPSSYRLNRSRIAIIPFQKLWAIQNSKPDQLNPSDYPLIEKLLQQCISEYNAKENNRIDLSEYKRQYMVMINDKGEREVWINCFCDRYTEEKQWRKKIVAVKDGGKCFFNLLINLTMQKWHNLSVNSDI